MHQRSVLVAWLLAVGGAATPLAAQNRIDFSIGVERVVPVGTLGSYVGPGVGVGAAIRVPLGGTAFALSFDADYLDAGPTTGTRRWGGPTSPYSVTIATGTRVFAFGAGPEADVERGPLRVGIGLGAGVAQVTNTSAVSGLYDLDPFARATAHSTVTWMLAAGADARVRVAGRRTPVRLELSLRWLGMGPTGTVREDHLLVGQISGAYLYPTPTETRFVVARAGVAIGR
jgi:hypothetical protein